MFKKKPSPTQAAQQRLAKMAGKRLRVAKTERACFLAALKGTQSTEATQQKAGRLVERVKAAKAADFLQQYRITA